MKKFGRRTVLQLNEKKSEKKPEPPIGFGGLVQYGNDNTDSEEEEEETTVTPTAMPASPIEQNGQAAAQPSSTKNGPDMDTQLADFLAEIESISKDEADSEETEGTAAHVETAAADSTSTTPQTSKQITPATSSEESESEEEEEPAPDVTKPTEPSTAWQHCLDEGTQHYYYWNTASNEVTWEIPEDYSKYLLLLKEYEERLAKYETTMKEWEERKKEPKKKMKKKNVANGAADSSAVENIEPRPLVDYKSETPEIKPNVELVTNKYGRGLGFSAEEGDITPYAPRHRATYPVNFVKGETVTNKLPELIPKVSKVEPSANQSRNNNSNGSTKTDRLSPAPSFPPQTVDMNKESDKSDSDADNDDEDDSVQDAQLPTFSASAAESTTPPCNGKQRETSVESKSDSDMELEDFDVDDIDRQLELALEKKLDGKPKHKRRLENNVDKNDIKRKKRTRDGSPPIRPLQPRPPALPPDDKIEKKKIVEEDIKLRAEVAELARDISDKLDFLEISRKSMSQLQILLIETATLR